MMQQFDQAPVEADAIESSLATIVQGSTAPSAFSVGKYIYLKHNGTLDPGLYRVKSAIAQGDTLSSSNLEQYSEGVVNSLNSNINNRTITTSGDKVTSVDSNSDLDNFKTGGVYVVRSDAIASTIAHMPRSASGRLIVIPEFSDNSNYVYQYYLPSTAANMVYSRKFVTSWSGWSQMANIKMMEETYTTTGSGNIQTGLFVDSTVILSAIVINRSDTMAIVSTWSGQGANASWGLNIRQCDASNQVVASTSVTVRIYYIEFLQ